MPALRTTGVRLDVFATLGGQTHGLWGDLQAVFGTLGCADGVSGAVMPCLGLHWPGHGGGCRCWNHCRSRSLVQGRASSCVPAAVCLTPTAPPPPPPPGICNTRDPSPPLWQPTPTTSPTAAGILGLFRFSSNARVNNLLTPPRHSIHSCGLLARRRLTRQNRGGLSPITTIGDPSGCVMQNVAWKCVPCRHNARDHETMQEKQVLR